MEIDTKGKAPIAEKKNKSAENLNKKGSKALQGKNEVKESTGTKPTRPSRQTNENIQK